MPVQVTAIMLGVEDLARSKRFYGEGLGCTIDQDHPAFVSFNLGEGSSSLAVAAGGGGVKEAAASPWGYFGYFSDPDGHLWKVASAS